MERCFWRHRNLRQHAAERLAEARDIKAFERGKAKPGIRPRTRHVRRTASLRESLREQERRSQRVDLWKTGYHGVNCRDMRKRANKIYNQVGASLLAELERHGGRTEKSELAKIHKLTGQITLRLLPRS